jgi:hypothetical protein
MGFHFLILIFESLNRDVRNWDGRTAGFECITIREILKGKMLPREIQISPFNDGS